jgi:hypothetical protein
LNERKGYLSNTATSPLFTQEPSLLKPVKQLNEAKSPWKDHPGRRAARFTEILKGQLPRTAQNHRKTRKLMVNNTGVNMGNPTHATADCYTL